MTTEKNSAYQRRMHSNSKCLPLACAIAKAVIDNFLANLIGASPRSRPTKHALPQGVLILKGEEGVHRIEAKVLNLLQLVGQCESLHCLRVVSLREYCCR